MYHKGEHTGRKIAKQYGIPPDSMLLPVKTLFSIAVSYYRVHTIGRGGSHGEFSECDGMDNG